MLEPEFEVISCVKDGHALVKAAAELKPDLVLVDVGMPVLNGLDAARELKKVMALPCLCKVIFLTMNPDPDIARAKRLGFSASGYSTEELAMEGRGTPAGGSGGNPRNLICNAPNDRGNGRELYPQPEVGWSPEAIERQATA